jgi:hypothetical protein
MLWQFQIVIYNIKVRLQHIEQTSHMQEQILQKGMDINMGLT